MNESVKSNMNPKKCTQNGRFESDFICLKDLIIELNDLITEQKVSRYGVFSGLFSPLFTSNTGKYGPEKIPYFDTFHAVNLFQ